MARPWNFNKADTIVDEIVSKEKTTVFRAPTTSAKLKPRVDNSLMSETALAEYRLFLSRLDPFISTPL